MSETTCFRCKQPIPQTVPGMIVMHSHDSCITALRAAPARGGGMMITDYLIVPEPHRGAWTIFDKLRNQEETITELDLEVYHYPRGATADIDTRVRYAYLTRLMEEGRYTLEEAALQHEIDSLL